MADMQKLMIKLESFKNDMHKLPRLGIGFEGYACDILGINELGELHTVIQERRRTWTLFKEDRLKIFIEKTCSGSLTHDNPLNQKQLHKISSPGVEIAQLIFKYKNITKKSLLPVNNSRIMTSVATAGSWQDGEFPLLFDALGCHYDCQTFKTVRKDRTCGRNGKKVLENDICIEYDQNAPKNTWFEVSEDLYIQLVEKSVSAKGSVDAIFHWGCISHNETISPNHKDTVEGWAWHEHWNILYCIAMARHALDFLKPGGVLVLKVRVFEEAETLGLISLLSCAFEEFHVFPNSHQLCEFGMVVGKGFLGSENDTVKKVQESLKKNTSYELHGIMCDTLTTEKKFHSTLKDAVAVREKMRCDHDYVSFIILQIIYHIQQCLSDQSLLFPYDSVQETLHELSGMDPIPVDDEWVSDILHRIEHFISTYKTSLSIRDKLNAFVEQWKLHKFSIDDGKQTGLSKQQDCTSCGE